MIVAGVMSGTSADGINVAFVRCRGRGLHTRFALLAPEQYSYTPALRTADMAAGGKGAPLVPFLDYLLFRHPRSGRILQNLGGIGNLTAIPAGAKAEQVIAFDTGPGNMVIDAVTQQLFGLPFDRNGKIAAQGRVLETIVNQALRGSFFQQKPPRTAGREQFGYQFAKQFMHWCN